MPAYLDVATTAQRQGDGAPNDAQVRFAIALDRATYHPQSGSLPSVGGGVDELGAVPSEDPSYHRQLPIFHTLEPLAMGVSLSKHLVKGRLYITP